MMPKIIIKIFMEAHSPKKSMPNNNGTIENIHPKMNELQIFPKRIVLIEIGQAINRSRVFDRVSHGKTTGPIDVDVMNITMAINPDII